MMKQKFSLKNNVKNVDCLSLDVKNKLLCSIYTIYTVPLIKVKMERDSLYILEEEVEVEEEEEGFPAFPACCSSPLYLLARSGDSIQICQYLQACDPQEGNDELFTTFFLKTRPNKDDILARLCSILNTSICYPVATHDKSVSSYKPAIHMEAIMSFLPHFS